MAEDKRYRRDYPKMTDAQKALVEENMGLVYMVAADLYQGTYEYDDLVQLGSLGLCLAAIDFNPDRGLAFSTFATHCIKRSIWRHHQIWTNAKRDLQKESYSLDERIKSKDGPSQKTHASMLVGAEDVEDMAIAHDLLDVVNSLKEQQRDVLTAHMNGCTLEEIGRQQGFSRARAGQVLDIARRHVRARWGA